MSSGMNMKEAEEIAKKMTFREAVNNALRGMYVPYKKATRIKLNELLEMLDKGLTVTEFADTCRECGAKYGKQKLIFDKIRAEIMQLDYDIETIGFDLNSMPADEMVHTICREEVLQIIDKYKAESEE